MSRLFNIIILNIQVRIGIRNRIRNTLVIPEGKLGKLGYNMREVHKCGHSELKPSGLKSILLIMVLEIPYLLRQFNCACWP